MAFNIKDVTGVLKRSNSLSGSVNYGGSAFGGGSLFGHQNRMGDNDEVQEKVIELAQELADVFLGEYAPDEVADRYRRLIVNAGFKYLGRGQNRIAFMAEGSSWVYKVPFREVGIRDNKIERYISSTVTTNSKVYNDIGKYIPIVSNFSLPDGWEDFMICAEYIGNLRADMLKHTDGTFLSAKEEAIAVCVENYEYISRIIRKLNKYFHMNDIHLVISAENFGVKGDEIAVRDIGYFVPRVGDLEFVTASFGGQDCQMIYWTLDNVPLTEEERKNTEARIAKLSTYAESWAPADNEGKLFHIESKDDLYDAADCIQALLQVFENTYL
nr:MAG TPA: hypothetical protein [Caudoviricetes sp.]